MLDLVTARVIRPWRRRTAARLALLVAAVQALVAVSIGPLQDAQAEEPAANLPALAVMPFANVSGDPASDFVAFGVADDLAADLAQIRRLQVTDFNLSSHYGPSVPDAKTVAEALGVGFLVTGAVHWTGETVQLDVALVLAETGETVWRRDYGGRLEAVSKYELAMVDGIVSYVTSPMTLEERLQFYARGQTRVPSAYLAVLRGKAHLRRSDAASLKRARKSFEVATELDPNYEKAHALLGYTYFLTERFEDCLSTANRRVTHDLAIVALHALRAQCYGGLGRVEEARRAGAEILRADPDFTIGRYASSLPHGGRSDLEKLSQALSLAGLPD